MSNLTEACSRVCMHVQSFFILFLYGLHFIAATTASVTNSAITACFLSYLTLLNYSAGILDINMRPQGNGFNHRARSRWGLKKAGSQPAPETGLENASIKVSKSTAVLLIFL